jgi:hypothetical protein
MGGGSWLWALGFRSTTNLLVLSAVRAALWELHGSFGLKAGQDDKTG